MTAAVRQQPDRKTSAPGATNACINAAPSDPYLALAGATIAAAIHDCRAGDADACVWILVGQGRHWLSLLVPTFADEDAVYDRLRACAPPAVQVRLFT